MSKQSRFKVAISEPEHMFMKKCLREFVPKKKCEAISDILIEISKKNGLRHAIFDRKGGYYIGEWKNGLKEGMGSYKSKNGKFLYEGFWKAGERHGYGVLSLLTKHNQRVIKYEGDWKNGNYDGESKWRADGSYYEGAMSKGKYEGKGRIWYPNHTYYEGEFHNDQRHGQGIMAYNNGNYYIGQWDKGLKEGKGIYYHIHHGRAQEGFWRNDKCIVSEVYDIDYKQSVEDPAVYPIPEIQLEHRSAIIQEARRSSIKEVHEERPAPPKQPICPCDKYIGKCKDTK